MKKLFMILLASAALAACGDGRSDQSEANDQMETTEPSVAPQNDMDVDDESTMSTDTTTTSGAGTTDAGSGIDTTSTQGTPVR